MLYPAKCVISALARAMALKRGGTGREDVFGSGRGGLSMDSGMGGTVAKCAQRNFQRRSSTYVSEARSPMNEAKDGVGGDSEADGYGGMILPGALIESSPEEDVSYAILMRSICRKMIKQSSNRSCSFGVVYAAKRTDAISITRRGCDHKAI
jgi:hypothetical protein